MTDLKGAVIEVQDGSGGHLFLLTGQPTFKWPKLGRQLEKVKRFAIRAGGIGRTRRLRKKQLRAVLRASRVEDLRGKSDCFTFEVTPDES